MHGIRKVAVKTMAFAVGAMHAPTIPCILAFTSFKSDEQEA